MNIQCYQKFSGFRLLEQRPPLCLNSSQCATNQNVLSAPSAEDALELLETYPQKLMNGNLN